MSFKLFFSRLAQRLRESREKEMTWFLNGADAEREDKREVERSARDWGGETKDVGEGQIR